MLNNNQKQIPRQTLLGGELHNLAYITPSESEVLRGLGGGVTPSGGQMMSRGVPAFAPGGQAEGGLGHSGNSNASNATGTFSFGNVFSRSPDAKGPAGKGKAGGPSAAESATLEAYKKYSEKLANTAAQNYVKNMQVYTPRLAQTQEPLRMDANRQQIDEFNAAKITQQNLIDAQKTDYETLPWYARRSIYNQYGDDGETAVDYAANPALGLMYEVNQEQPGVLMPATGGMGWNKPAYRDYSTPYNDTRFRTERGALIAAPGITKSIAQAGPSGSVTHYNIDNRGSGKTGQWSRGDEYGAQAGPSYYSTYEAARDARDRELLGKYESGMINLDTGEYLPPPDPLASKKKEKSASNFDLSASNIGSARYGDTGTGLLLSPEESALANQSFRRQLLGEQNRVATENAGLNLLKSGLIG
jgi:hypothetical protein|tara:strand:- start:3437 stop:4684 length:1248 start_codon:yes stop_codon:yes gene_type:complete